MDVALSILITCLTAVDAHQAVILELVRAEQRFPPPFICRANMAFGLEYQSWLSAAYPLSPRHRWEWAQAEAEASWCWHCWDACNAAVGGESCDPAYRLRWLGNLRDMIGDEAFYAGRMPPPAPVWRFQMTH